MADLLREAYAAIGYSIDTKSIPVISPFAHEIVCRSSADRHRWGSGWPGGSWQDRSLPQSSPQSVGGEQRQGCSGHI